MRFLRRKRPPRVELTEETVRRMLAEYIVNEPNGPELFVQIMNHERLVQQCVKEVARRTR